MKFEKKIFSIFLVLTFSLNINAKTIIKEFKDENISYKIIIQKDFNGLKEFENNYVYRNYSEESTREKIKFFYDMFIPAVVEITNNSKESYDINNDTILAKLSDFGHELALYYNPRIVNLNFITNKTILFGIPILILFFFISQKIDPSDTSMWIAITSLLAIGASAITQMSADGLNYLGLIQNPYHNKQFENLINGYVEKNQVKSNVFEIKKNETFTTVRYLIKDQEIIYDQSFLENLFKSF